MIKIMNVSYFFCILLFACNMISALFLLCYYYYILLLYSIYILFIFYSLHFRRNTKQRQILPGYSINMKMKIEKSYKEKKDKPGWPCFECDIDNSFKHSFCHGCGRNNPESSKHVKIISNFIKVN